MRSGKTMALDLINAWQMLWQQQQAAPEVAYRLQKMIAGLLPLVDRPYLKTPKAQETLHTCLHQTALLEEALRRSDKDVFLQLTDLEHLYEEFLTRTYEFRVKAG
ncbi:MAG: hypothetical protein ACUVRZ_07125 [Desulfobacca sp.]|uniref:hypothetical protein n=1 Tax=Desulfobacca sp. TaxID=2067990 RepID=UPI004049BC5C